MDLNNANTSAGGAGSNESRPGGAQQGAAAAPAAAQLSGAAPAAAQPSGGGTDSDAVGEARDMASRRASGTGNAAAAGPSNQREAELERQLQETLRKLGESERLRQELEAQLRALQGSQAAAGMSAPAAKKRPREDADAGGAAVPAADEEEEGTVAAAAAEVQGGAEANEEGEDELGKEEVGKVLQ